MSPYDEGREAYLKGEREAENPYTKYPEFNQWSSGWHQERMAQAIRRRFVY